MSSSIENGVLWEHLFERKGFRVDARSGVIAGGVRIYRIMKGEHRQVIGRREAPQVLIGALESRKKTVVIGILDLSKADILAIAQAITKDITGEKDDFVGGTKQILQILRKLDVPAAPPVLLVRRVPKPKKEEKPQEIKPEEGKPEEGKPEEKKP
jgi:hypothetical protein